MIFGISLPMVKADRKKCLTEEFFFPEQACYLFFFLFLICVICLLHVFKTETCSLGSEFLTDLCYENKLHADAFVIPLNFFRARYDFVIIVTIETLV